MIKKMFLILAMLALAISTAGCATGRLATRGNENSGGGVVTIGQLMWQKQASPNAMDWPDAMSYCENLSLGGSKNWRLPSIGELRSLIRGCSLTQSGGACGVTGSCRSVSCSSDACSGCSEEQGPANGCFWPVGLDGACSWFWSSSSGEGSSDGDLVAWYVDFKSSLLRPHFKMIEMYVRCVRDAG